MKRSDKRYVAYFDMLGMQHATLRNPEEAWGALSDLNAAKEYILSLAIEISKTGEVIRDHVHAFTFSDMIVMFTLSDSPEDLRAIFVLSSQLFAESLSKCVPLRGAIAHGDFFFNLDQNLFVGMPLVKAHITAEEAQWFGIVVDSYVEKMGGMISLAGADGEPAIIRWDVPLKDNRTKNQPVINWPALSKKNFTKLPVSIQDYYQAFERLFGPYEELSESVKAKYKNTVAFINHQLGYNTKLHQ